MLYCNSNLRYLKTSLEILKSGFQNLIYIASIAIHTCVRTYIHTYMRTYVHTYIHAYVRTYIHTYVRTYIHMYIRTYTYIQT